MLEEEIARTRKENVNISFTLGLRTVDLVWSLCAGERLSLPNALGHDAAFFGCQGAADAVFSIMRQAQVVTHLMSNSRRHSY